MKFNKKLILACVPVLSVALLVSCNGNNESSSNVSTTTIAKNIPVALQLKTAASAYAPTTSTNASANIATSTSCGVVVTAANPIVSALNSTQWWSTANISFNVTNTCEAPISFTNLDVKVKGIALNNNGVSGLTIGSIAQSGQGPWSNVNTTTSGNDIDVVISTPACTGDYCSWAQLPAGQTRTFSLSTSASGPMNSLTVASISVDGNVEPVTPTVTPTVTPVIATGTLTIKYSTETSLTQECATATTCPVILKVLDPSTTQVLDTESFDLKTLANNSISLGTLLPGNYTIIVDASGLPAGSAYVTTPTSGVVAVSANNTSTASVNFSYTAPAAVMHSLTLSAVNPDANSFKSTTSLNAEVIDNTVNQTYTVSVPFGSTAKLSNFLESHTYTIVSQGVANAATGAYYSGYYLADQTINKDTTKVLTLTKVTPDLSTVFTVSGLESNVTAPTLSLAENSTGSTSQSFTTFYQFEPVSLATGTYKFLSSQAVTINVTNPTGYTLSSINPIVVTGGTTPVTTVTVTYAKSTNNATYDFTSKFQGGAGSTITLTNTSAFINPQVAVITTNFNPTTAVDALASNCFSSGYNTTTATIKQLSNGSYQTTVVASPKTDWQGNVTGKNNLTLSNTCGFGGGNTVLSGVVYGLVTSVIIDGQSVPMTSSCSSGVCVDPGHGKVISGYYPQWARYGKAFYASDIPYDRLNEVLYAFIGFDETNGNITSLDSFADENEMPTLAKAMLQYPYLKGTLSFGGWTNGTKYPAVMFETLTQSDTAMNNFVSQAVASMRAANYTGIDIDWEWWSSYSNAEAPSAHQIKLYKALRTAIDAASKADGKKYYLSIAVSAGLDKIQAIDNSQAGAWATIAGLVDHINVMAYDMHGAFDADSTGKTPGVSDFQAPWDMETNSPYASTKYDIKDAMAAYVAHSVPSTKLVLGIPAYGRAMIVSSATGSNYGLYQTITGTPGGDFDDATSGVTGVFLYKCIVNAASDASACHANASTVSGLTYVSQTSNSDVFKQYSSKAQEPWGYGSTPAGNIFITYDDVDTAKYKSQQVLDSNYGGAMVWEIDGDDVTNPSQSLFSAINSVFAK